MKRVLLLSSVALVACGSRLPAEVPANLLIRYSVSGGMLPTGELFEIRADGRGTYQKSAAGTQASYELHARAAEVAAAYRVLRENAFDRIATERRQVYDRGGPSLAVTAGDVFAHVSNSGMEFVTAGSQGAWSASLAAVRELLGRALRQSQAALAVRIDASLAGHVVLLRAGPDAPAERVAGPFPAERTLRRVRGKQRLTVTLEDVPGASAEEEVSFGEVPSLTVSFREGRLQLAR